MCLILNNINIHGYGADSPLVPHAHKKNVMKILLEKRNQPNLPGFILFTLA